MSANGSIERKKLSSAPDLPDTPNVRDYVGSDGVYRTIDSAGNIVVHDGSPAVLAHELTADPHPQYATILEATAAAPVQSVNSLTGAVVLTKSSLGLSNVDNTSDVSKPTSTAQLASINGAISTHNVANRHIDHSDVFINSGSGLTGGGDLTASRTLNLEVAAGNVGTFGDSANSASVSVDIFGRVFAAGQSAISIASSAITDFAASVRSTVLTGFSASSATPVAATDSVLAAIGKLQAQLYAAGGSEWSEQFTTADQIITVNTLTNVPELQLSVTANKVYLLDYTLIYRTISTATGIGFSLVTGGGANGDLAANVMIPQNTADGTNAFWFGAITSSVDSVISTSTPAAQPTWFIADIKGKFRCTASGTLQLQFRSETNGSNVNLGRGSSILARMF